MRLLAAAVLGLFPATALGSTAQASPDLPAELASDGVDLVRAGQAYLDRGELGSAVEVLTEAVHREPRTSDAQLLLALALARVRVEHPDAVCDWGAWPDRIEAHLLAAWTLDPTVLDRLETEAALAPLRQATANSLRVRLWGSRGRAWEPTRSPKAVEVAGVPVVRKEGVVKRKLAEQALVDLEWYGLDGDGEHDDTVVDFREDGTVIRATVSRDADSDKHATYTRGTWTLDKQGLHLELAGEPTLLWLTLDGLQVDPAPDTPRRFIDQPVDCTRPFDVWAGLP